MSVDRVGNVARVALVLAACIAAAGSATSSSGGSRNQSARGGRGDQESPPPPQQMEPDRALGLWRSTFGAVKIEPDSSHGGLEAGSVQGIWMYQRQGQEVIGYFAGNLRGNVLEFRWQEPNTPPLTGDGYLVFDVQGRQYSGRWWSDKRDRVGDWNGWRPPMMQGAEGRDPAQVDRNDAYGQPQPGSYRQQSYPPRPSPYQPPPGQPSPDQPSPYRPPPYQPSPYQQSQPPAQPPQQPPAQPTYYN
ncbi:MAG TPA: hypothetical protein VFT22_12425 [Kofleriaceae bacterium]|nr:hypothetical protein [Kofleriaceae bacterium]